MDNGLVAKLIDRQGATPDGEFARPLGLSRNMWGQVRRGQRRLGVHSLARIHRAYPDLAGEVLSYVLAARNTE